MENVGTSVVESEEALDTVVLIERELVGDVESDTEMDAISETEAVTLLLFDKDWDAVISAEGVLDVVEDGASVGLCDLLSEGDRFVRLSRLMDSDVDKDSEFVVETLGMGVSDDEGVNDSRELVRSVVRDGETETVPEREFEFAVTLRSAEGVTLLERESALLDDTDAEKLSERDVDPVTDTSIDEERVGLTLADKDVVRDNSTERVREMETLLTDSDAASENVTLEDVLWLLVGECSAECVFDDDAEMDLLLEAEMSRVGDVEFVVDSFVGVAG